MDVTFFEDKPFFGDPLQGGTRHVEELVEDDDVFRIKNQISDQNFVDR